MLKLYFFVVLFISISSLYSQESKSNSEVDKIIKRLKEYEKKFDNYERQIKDLKEEVKNLRERVSEVEEDKKVEELREEVEDLIEETESEVIRENTLGLLNSYLGTDFVNISGYYSFVFWQDDKSSSPSRFRAHELTFFFQKQLHKFNLFAEIAFENAPSFDAEDGEVHGSGEIFVEQAWLEYLYDPLFNVRVGLMLTPEARNLHHYPTTTYSIYSPVHTTKIFPREFVGISAYGDTEYLLSESFGVGYILYISNGESLDKGKTDSNENKVFGGKLILHLPLFNFLEQFDIAANFSYGKTEDKDRDLLWNIEVILEIKNFFLHIEYAQGRRYFHDKTLGLRENYGGFLEMAYTFWDKYSIYGRGEIFDPDRRALDHSKRILFGLRYKPISEISIKGEFFYEWHRDSSEENFSGFAVSIVALL
ncbi:MAG: hypothetical protein HUU50_05145 [Candidatus Brocadiae bacterium]|nr:hypothetical protein [Candidatus Brocadiia bacterium]